MELKTDAILKGPTWAKTIDLTVGKTGKFFKTNWELYALSITIGMMHDCQIESDDMVPEGYDDEPRYVPRNVMGDIQRRPLLEFMLQTAMITTKHLELTENERLEVAFSEEKKLDYNPVLFLTKFANYGVTKIYEVIEDTDDVEMMETLMAFLNEIYEAGAVNVEDEIELDDLDE